MPISSAAEHVIAGPRKPRPYVFLGQTTSLCETCMGLVPAKIIEEGGAVYYLKRCAEHGVQNAARRDQFSRPERQGRRSQSAKGQMPKHGSPRRPIERH